jgi:CRISPR system Cascade subunit CasC
MTTTKPLYVDFHIIQSVPPSNLNRDDTGSPKTAIYGGARRSRVSSQAWKRAARIAFQEDPDPQLKAVRTRRLRELLINRLTDRAQLSADLASRVSSQLLADLGVKAGKKEQELSYLLYFGIPQIDAAVDKIRTLELSDDVEDAALKEALTSIQLRDSLGVGHPVHVALFGRMIADIPQLGVDAAVQVAHALSTHAIEQEFDYFTAVDDMNPVEDTGAGMIGTVEFNSATYYRFASVGMHLLAENLSGSWSAAVAALDAFVEGFVLSIPSGHQNSFGHRTRPALVAAVVREGQPVNLVTAFEAPVTGSGGVLSESMDRLARAFVAERDRWGDAPVAVIASWSPDLAGSEADAAVISAFGSSLSFADLRERLRAVVAARGE